MIPKNYVWNGRAWVPKSKKKEDATSSLRNPHSPIRKRFETWYRKKPRIALERDGNNYFDDRTQLAWEAWQIAWAEAYDKGLKIGRNRVFFGRKKK